MKFAMLTTSFGAHSLDGDAAFVERLSRALARHGHEVHVIYCRDSTRRKLRGRQRIEQEPPPGVTTHPLSSPVGPLSPIVTHLSGRPAFKARAIRSLLSEIRPDVIHYHDLSLIGGPGLLAMPAPGAIKLMTVHDHWLVCPTRLLWKHDQGVCETRACVRCCVRARRPPQPWRKTSVVDRSLGHLDALIAPSLSTIREHSRRGISRTMTHLPYFLPHEETGTPATPPPDPGRPPYIAMSGRLEKTGGFQDVIAAMRRFPQLELRIAGFGGYESELRTQAQGMGNVHFEGPLDPSQLAALFRGARAVAVPSLVYEAFGYVVLEAFAERTPVLVRDLGALPELVAVSGGGLVFRTEEELVGHLDRLACDDDLRHRLGSAGYWARRGIWSESEHLDRYFALIQDRRRSRRTRVDRAHQMPAPAFGIGPASSPRPIPRRGLPVEKPS